MTVIQLQGKILGHLKMENKELNSRIHELMIEVNRLEEELATLESKVSMTIVKTASAAVFVTITILLLVSVLSS